MSSNSQKSINSIKHKRLFYVIAAFIPFLFLLILEGGLRFVGFGKDSPLFITNPANEQYLLATPNVMDRYFPFDKNKPQVTLETDFFLANKANNEIRIFVQGGSTAAGFPYGLGASLAGMLEQRLRRSLPHKKVEVINTAMSAVNSFTLLDLADEIIEQQPDMVLIYAGHNEYLGILGASSNFSNSNSFWYTRTMLVLKDYRIFQLFQWLYSTFKQQEINNKQVAQVNQRTTMMAKVANEQSIAFGSAVYKAGLAQFETNMEDLLAKYKAAGIPVIISTIASNHKDQAPFKSSPIKPEHNELLKKLRAGMAQKYVFSENELQAYSAKFEGQNSAKLHFEFASIVENVKANTLAQKHYELAVQHDLLKFRAPNEINTVIRKLAQQYNAQLVDVKSAFEKRASNGLIGKALMLEHLHPNLQGYFVIANAFYAQITRHSLFTDFKNIPVSIAWQQRLVLPSEEYYGYATIQHLKSNYPFVEQAQIVVLSPPMDASQALGLAYFNKDIDWTQMMHSNLEHYTRTNDSVMVSKTLQILADAMPHNGLHNLRIAQLMHKKQDIPLAIHYYQRARLAGVVQPNIDLILANLE